MKQPCAIIDGVGGRAMKFQVMLSVFFMLLANKKTTLKQICSRFEISKRTALRYINAISMSGIPVISELGRNGGYSLPEDFKLSNTFFTKEELEFLIALVENRSDCDSDAFQLSLLEKLKTNLSCIEDKNV